MFLVILDLIISNYSNLEKFEHPLISKLQIFID